MAATRRPPGTAPYRTGRNRVDVQREQLMSVYLGVSGRLCGSAPPSQPGAAVAWRSSEDPVKNAGWFTQARPSGAVTAAPPFGGIPRATSQNSPRACRQTRCVPQTLPQRVASRYWFDEFEIDIPAYELRRFGRAVPLEPQVFEVLLCSIRNDDGLRRRMRSSMPSGPSDT